MSKCNVLKMECLYLICKGSCLCLLTLWFHWTLCLSTIFASCLLELKPWQRKAWSILYLFFQRDNPRTKCAKVKVKSFGLFQLLNGKNATAYCSKHLRIPEIKISKQILLIIKRGNGIQVIRYLGRLKLVAKSRIPQPYWIQSVYFIEFL